MAGEKPAPQLDGQATQIVEDNLAREAADAARSKLEMDAVTASFGALDAARAKSSDYYSIPGLGEYAGTKTTEKAGGGTVKVKEQVVRGPAAPEGGNLFDIPSPLNGGGRNRTSTATTELTAPAKGFGILGVPDMDRATEDRSSVITSKTIHSASDVTRERTKDGQIVPGEDTIAEETILNGSRRIVKRKISTGPGNDGKTVIMFEQESTDLNGENPRSITRIHTDDAPSKETTLKTGKVIDEAKAARRALEVVGGRAVSKQKGMEHRIKEPANPDHPQAIPVREDVIAAADAQPPKPPTYRL